MDAWIHILQESVTVIMALVVLKTIQPLCKNHENDIPELFWIRMWATFGLVFTLFHIILSATGILTGVSMAVIIPLTYLPERISDSILAIYCAKPPKLIKDNPKLNKRVIMTISSILILTITIIGVWLSNTSALQFDSIFGRPQEFLQIIPAWTVFIAMLSVKKRFGKLLKWSTLATVIGGVLMLFSSQIFDTAFDMAHNFKIISYSIMAINTYLLSKKLKLLK